MLLGEYYENLSFNHGLMVNISYAGIPTDFPLHWHTFVEIMIPTRWKSLMWQSAIPGFSIPSNQRDAKKSC